MANINNTTTVQTSVKLGDYVFASRWSDCDPNDPWAVGFVTGLIQGKDSKVFVTIGDLEGKPIPNIGNRWFHNVIPISHKLGKKLCETMPSLEGSAKPKSGWKRFLGIPEII